MTKLLVTGVSGAVGTRVVPQLAQQPDVDTIIGLDVAPLPQSAPKLRFVGQSVETAELPSLLHEVQTVVHLATDSVAATRRLLEACAAASVRHVVLVSTAAVYGASRTNPVPLTETSPLRPNPGFAYVTERAEQERLVLEWATANPLVDVCVLRLALVLGGGLEKALAAALGGVEAYRHVQVSRPVQFLHIDDTCSAIAFAVEQRLSGIYNVAPVNFIGDATARAVAGALPRPTLPARAAYVANKVTWKKLYRSDYSLAQPYLEYPWVVSSAKLQAAGWRPAYTSEEALVAEAKPTWWASLRPGQRRNLVSGSIVAASSLSTAGAVATGIYALARRRR